MMPTTPRTELDCPFCEIARGQDDDARQVFGTEDVVAFFPPEPATLGHTLLIPRAHVQDIWALNLDLASELARWTVRLAEAVKRAIQPDGLNVIQSNGVAATQTVMHLHVHVVPRWEGDPVGRIWPPETHYSEDQKNDAWEALRQEFRPLTQFTKAQSSAARPTPASGP